MGKVNNENEICEAMSPLRPLHEMEGLIDEFGEALRRADGWLSATGKREL